MISKRKLWFEMSLDSNSLNFANLAFQTDFRSDPSSICIAADVDLQLELDQSVESKSTLIAIFRNNMC